MQCCNIAAHKRPDWAFFRLPSLQARGLGRDSPALLLNGVENGY